MDVLLNNVMARVDKACPKQDRVKRGNQELTTQLESYAYLFNMVWSGAQLAGFMIILLLFLVSSDNEFNRTKECCEANIVLRDELEIPIQECSQNACELHKYLYPDERDFIQKRPRRPKDGDFSKMFEYNGGQWCCNLDVNSDECCDRQPWGVWCTACMWVAAFSSICAMVMTQTVTQGVYSFSARRKPWHPILVVFPMAMVRTVMFFVIYYIFWAFMFSFIFFWIAMFYCDNIRAFNYYKLGYKYLYFWFVHFGEVFSTPARDDWDGKMDTDAFVGSHSIFAICTDFFFTVAYFFLNRYKDSHGHAFINLGYFDL